MREIIARTVSVITVGLIVGLSWLFASRHNQADPNSLLASGLLAVAAPSSVTESAEANPTGRDKNVPPAPPGSTTETERGRAVYTEQKCTTCHSMGGEGNPRYPLDGVGARWEPDELREWITGTGVAKEVLSPGMAKRKLRYRSMQEEDMSALIAFLSGATSN